MAAVITSLVSCRDMFFFEQISHSCTSDSLSNTKVYPTFLRTVGPYSGQKQAVLATFRHFKWERCSILTSSQGLFISAASTFRRVLDEADIEVAFFEAFEPGSDMLPLVQKLNDLKSRIVLMCAYDDDFGSFVWSIDQLGLVSTGWAWVGLANAASNVYTSISKLARAANKEPPPPSVLQGAVALFPALTQANASACEQFEGEVRMRMRDFGIVLPEREPIDPYAWSLYDAVLLYAKSAAAVLKHGGSPRDTGALLVAAKNITFQGMSGYVQLEPETGDRLLDTQVCSAVCVRSR